MSWDVRVSLLQPAPSLPANHVLFSMNTVSLYSLWVRWAWPLSLSWLDSYKMSTLLMHCVSSSQLCTNSVPPHPMHKLLTCTWFGIIHLHHTHNPIHLHSNSLYSVCVCVCWGRTPTSNRGIILLSNSFISVAIQSLIQIICCGLGLSIRMKLQVFGIIMAVTGVVVYAASKMSIICSSATAAASSNTKFDMTTTMTTTITTTTKPGPVAGIDIEMTSMETNTSHAVSAEPQCS